MNALSVLNPEAQDEIVDTLHPRGRLSLQAVSGILIKVRFRAMILESNNHAS